MGIKSLSLHLGDQYMVDEATKQVGVSGGLARANTVGVRSGRLAFRVPHNTRWTQARIFAPVIKLLTSAAADISGLTMIYVFRHVPGLLPVYFARFAYQDYSQLTAILQRNRENRVTLDQDLGQPIALEAEDELAFEFDGGEIIDWTQAGNSFNFRVETISGGI